MDLGPWVVGEDGDLWVWVCICVNFTSGRMVELVALASRALNFVFWGLRYGRELDVLFYFGCYLKIRDMSWVWILG